MHQGFGLTGPMCIWSPRTSASPPPAGNNYVSEDGADKYVAEDGTDYYVTET